MTDKGALFDKILSQRFVGGKGELETCGRWAEA